MPMGQYGDAETRTCPNCLKPYQARQPNQVYCQASCRREAHQRSQTIGRAEAQRLDALAMAIMGRLEGIEKRLSAIEERVGAPRQPVKVIVEDARGLAGLLEEVAVHG